MTRLYLSRFVAEERLFEEQHICEEDLDMVRDQIITVEVNIARVFNSCGEKAAGQGRGLRVCALSGEVLAFCFFHGVGLAVLSAKSPPTDRATASLRNPRS